MEPQGAEGIEPDTPVLRWRGERRRKKHNTLRERAYSKLHVIYTQSSTSLFRNTTSKSSLFFICSCLLKLKNDVLGVNVSELLANETRFLFLLIIIIIIRL